MTFFAHYSPGLKIRNSPNRGLCIGGGRQVFHRGSDRLAENRHGEATAVFGAGFGFADHRLNIGRIIVGAQTDAHACIIRIASKLDKGGASADSLAVASGVDAGLGFTDSLSGDPRSPEQPVSTNVAASGKAQNAVLLIAVPRDL